MVLTLFLFTGDLVVLVAKQGFLNLIIKYSTWQSQFKFWSNQTPRNFIWDCFCYVQGQCTDFCSSTDFVTVWLFSECL